MSRRLSWAIRLERAEKRGKFTSADEELSSHWRSCAIGEKHNWPKSDVEGWEFVISSEEAREFMLGMDFLEAVSNDDISEAKCIYAEIQALP